MAPSHESRGSSIYLNSRKNSVKYGVDMPSNKKSSNYSPKNAHSYYRWFMLFIEINHWYAW